MEAIRSASPVGEAEHPQAVLPQILSHAAFISSDTAATVELFTKVLGMEVAYSALADWNEMKATAKNTGTRLVVGARCAEPSPPRRRDRAVTVSLPPGKPRGQFEAGATLAKLWSSIEHRHGLR